MSSWSLKAFATCLFCFLHSILPGVNDGHNFPRHLKSHWPLEPLLSFEGQDLSDPNPQEKSGVGEGTRTSKTKPWQSASHPCLLTRPKRRLPVRQAGGLHPIQSAPSLFIKPHNARPEFPGVSDELSPLPSHRMSLLTCVNQCPDKDREPSGDSRDPGS